MHFQIKKKTIPIFLLLIASGILALAWLAPQGAGVHAARPVEDGALLSAGSLLTGTTELYIPAMYHDLDNPNLYGMELSDLSVQILVDLTADTGAYLVRKNALFWSSVQPTQNGGYQWGNVAALDDELETAADAGLHPILVIRSTPSWAQLYPGYYCGPMKAQYFNDFGNFLAAAVARYSGPPFYIRHFEIWNEPDVSHTVTDPDDNFGCWGVIGDPYYGGRFYGNMLKVVYPKMKAANPNIEVIIGGLLLDCDPRNPPSGNDCDPSNYLEGILVAGAENSFDGVSFHAYDYYNWILNTFGNPNWNSGRYFGETNGVMQPVLLAKAGFINEVLGDYGVGPKSLYNTEVALLCGSNNDPPGQPGCDATDTSPYELMKKAYVAQAYAEALGAGLDANIWFTITGWRNSGLVYSNGAPRPAYDAYTYSNDMLVGAHYTGKVTGISKVTGYKFNQPDGTKVWVMWATDGQSHAVTLSATPLAIFDSLGNSIPVTGTTVTLKIEPYYVIMP